MLCSWRPSQTPLKHYWTLSEDYRRLTRPASDTRCSCQYTAPENRNSNVSSEGVTQRRQKNKPWRSPHNERWGQGAAVPWVWELLLSTPRCWCPYSLWAILYGNTGNASPLTGKATSLNKKENKCFKLWCITQQEHWLPSAACSSVFAALPLLWLQPPGPAMPRAKADGHWWFWRWATGKG